MPKIFLPAKIEETIPAKKFISNTLIKYHITGKEKTRAVLLAEEAMVKFIGTAPEDGEMQISIHRLYNTANITISAKGEAFDGDDFIAPVTGLKSSHKSEEAIRSMLLRANANRISYSRRGEYNFVTIGAGAKERLLAVRTFFCFFSAIIVALLLNLFIDEAAKQSIVNNLLDPLKDIFLNSLKMVTAPAVFFSLTMVIARMTSFFDPGRITFKIIASYVTSSVTSVILGIAIFKGFDYISGFDLFLRDSFTQASGGWQNNPISETIVGFIPDNIVEPFLNTNSVQLLILAILAGFALGRVENHSTFLSNLAGALDKFFSSIVEIVINFVPVFTFFVTILSIFSFGWKALWAAVQILALVIIGLLITVCGTFFYILFIGRLNPVIFFKKSWKTMVSTFLGGSSLNAVPDNTHLCERQFGVPSTLTAFSIPFGATANLNGNCIYLAIAGLSLAKLCGVNISGNGLITIAFMVLVLSVGAPITPGSAMLALTLLMTQMGVSLAVISIMPGINALLEMLLAAFNTLDDLATTLVVAKNEHILDEDIYYDRKKAESRAKDFFTKKHSEK